MTELIKLADSLGIKGKEFNYIYSLHIQKRKEEAIQFIQDVTKCDNELSTKIFEELMNDMPTPSQNEIKRVNTPPVSSTPTVTCPYCKSANTKKISGLSKAGSVALFGIFAVGKVSKQWHCNQCGSDF